MKRLILAVSLILTFAIVIAAQTSAPKPDPALQKLQALVGHWTYQGEYKAGPLGPGGKITGVYDCRPILGGFFLQAEETEKGAEGETHNIEIDGYDPVSKNFTFQGFQSEGSTWSGVILVAGNTMRWDGKYVIAGKPYLIKADFTLAPNSMSGVEEMKISADGGKTWVPFLSAKWSKGAAKK
jgi:hypothetical protein